MGKVQCVYKLMPESDETDLEDIKESVKQKIDVDDFEEEEVAFGLKAVKISTITSDEEGGTDAVEERLEEVEGIQSIELEHFDKL
ncbi:MAG: elongation factor 1-beta [Candidatus Nanohaloarchaea archaeon]